MSFGPHLPLSRTTSATPNLDVHECTAGRRRATSPKMEKKTKKKTPPTPYFSLLFLLPFSLPIHLINGFLWVVELPGSSRDPQVHRSALTALERERERERAPHTSSQKHAHDIACAHTRVPQLKVAATTATTCGSLKLLLLFPPAPFRDRSTPSPEPVRPALPRVLWFDRPSRDCLRPCGLERRLSGDGLVAGCVCLTFNFETEEFGVIVVLCFVRAMLSTV